MKKLTVFGLLAMIAVGTVFSAAIVSAYRGDYSVKGPDCTEDRHELMMDAFESMDYDAWKELMESKGMNGKVLQVINADNFETFVMAHQAAKSGDTDLAQELRSQLGLNNGIGQKDGQGFGKSSGFGEMKGKGQGAGHGKLFKNR